MERVSPCHHRSGAGLALNEALDRLPGIWVGSVDLTSQVCWITTSLHSSARHWVFLPASLVAGPEDAGVHRRIDWAPGLWEAENQARSPGEPVLEDLRGPVGGTWRRVRPIWP